MEQEQPSQLSSFKKFAIALACLCSGVAILAPKWITNDGVKIYYGIFIALFFFILSFIIKKYSTNQKFWQLPFAFFIFAFVQILNNTLPPYLLTHFLHQTTVNGNPLASTVWGTVAIQLLETLIAIIPIILFNKLSGESLDSIYVNKGRIGKQFIFATVAFVVLYIITARIPSHHIFPMGSLITLKTFITLTPALLISVISNGFQEELLFRGLFLNKYEYYFGGNGANIMQSIVFTIAHAGISYTPALTFFLIFIVFPLGLFAGYLMRSSKGLLAPAIFHAGVDMPIYLVFLSYIIKV